VQQHAEVLVSPLHNAPGDVEWLGTGVCRPEQPRQITVPADQLTIHVAAIFPSKKRGDGEHILDLGGDFAEFDVLNQGQDASVLCGVTRLVMSS
jgi:hypothetical protein